MLVCFWGIKKFDVYGLSVFNPGIKPRKVPVFENESHSFAINCEGKDDRCLAWRRANALQQTDTAREPVS